MPYGHSRGSQLTIIFEILGSLFLDIALGLRMRRLHCFETKNFKISLSAQDISGMSNTYLHANSFFLFDQCCSSNADIEIHTLLLFAS
jgi:hypothetical protein